MSVSGRRSELAEQPVFGGVVSQVKITFCEELSMRSRTVAAAVLMASGLMSVGVGSAHAVGYTPITAPSGAAQWGNTSAIQTSSGSTTTYDNEVHSGTANNFGQEVTNYGSVGTNYANEASASNTIGGSATQYSSAVGAYRPS
jgi:hypothetical protein